MESPSAVPKRKPRASPGEKAPDARQVIEAVPGTLEEKDENLEWFLNPNENIDLATDVDQAMLFPATRLLWFARLIRSNKVHDFGLQFLRLSVSRGRKSRNEWRDIFTARAERERRQIVEGQQGGKGLF